jgi:hypothetical protein
MAVESAPEFPKHIELGIITGGKYIAVVEDSGKVELDHEAELYQRYRSAEGAEHPMGSLEHNSMDIDG